MAYDGSGIKPQKQTAAVTVLFSNTCNSSQTQRFLLSQLRTKDLSQAQSSSFDVLQKASVPSLTGKEALVCFSIKYELLNSAQFSS